MTAVRCITIRCDQCGIVIDSDEFDDIPEARRLAKEYKGMKVRRVQNGSLWDICKDCNKTFTRD